jgi:hypothetical protein
MAVNELSTSDLLPAPKPPWWQAALEATLVFAVFFLQGAWPVPDVNEPYYLGKAIHFWNPEWIPNDTFLNSSDTHNVFYFAFGWLAIWLSPLWLAWVGRLLTWALLAWSWRRLSFALVPRRWLSVLTAALFVCLLERFHMAGEWVVGGVEAKGFAYVLVFLGLESLARARWNRAWLLLGGASAFHVLVGGWSVIAAGIAWLLLRDDRPPLRSMLPALAGGFALSLPALIPCLRLTWGIDPETVRRANEIYVFERLGHHLVPSHFPAEYVDRFLLLVVLLLVLDRITPLDAARRRLRTFIFGALAIAAVGVGAGFLEWVSRPLAASLLRFYWFRLSDVAVPLGVALVGTRYAVHAVETEPRWGRWALGLAVLVGALHVGRCAVLRAVPTVPRADLVDHADADRQVLDYLTWRDACRWIAESSEVPADARFLTPRSSQTFKWYAGRSEVVTWKDVPQDARSIAEWWDDLVAVYADPSPYGGYRWYASLAEQGAERLRRLGKTYGADYVLTVRWPRPELPVVYENRVYVIYALGDPPDAAEPP